MKRGIHLIFIFAMALLLVVVSSVKAQAGWSHDPAINTAITTQAGADTNPAMIDDGAGSEIIAWMDPSKDIRVQKIDTNGNLLWTASGKVLTSGGNNYYPQLASDMAGGAIITWQKGSAGSGIYVQRIDSQGNELWSPGGEFVALNNEDLSGNHQNPWILSDGQQGAIIVWQDSRSVGSNVDTGFDIYAQRVHSDQDGDLEELWGGDGLPICTETGDQKYPQLISDGSSGAIITWKDGRVGSDIYAQRVDSDGDCLWAIDGNRVNFSTQDHGKPQITVDGSGGAIITWQVGGDGSGGIFAQRFDENGGPIWINNYPSNLAVATGQINRQNPQIVSDGSNGAIIAWWGINSSNGSSIGIFAQRIDTNGVAKWTANGVTVASLTNIDTSDSPQIVGDGNQGAVITWADQRNGSDYDIYSQRIKGTDGSALWSSNGIPVSTVPNQQQLPRLISNGSGGGIIAWQDQRSGDWNLYAQKLLSDGTLPIVLPTVTTAAVSAITFTTATSGGNVTSDGGVAAVTARGVCWGASPDPVIGPSCISAGSGVGSFVAVISGLTANTPYHVRAYATSSVGTGYGSDIQFTTPVLTSLTVSMSGNGGGRITSNPAGIDCTSATNCPANFANNIDVTLTATPNGDSLFGVWGGDCAVSNGKCTVNITGVMSATATFDYVQPVKIQGSATPYTLIASAYGGIAGGGTIQARVHEFTENLNFNRSIPAILKGGYDTAYNGNSGLTTVKGTVTVTAGNLTVENLAIK